MAQEVTREALSYASADGKSIIRGCLWSAVPYTASQTAPQAVHPGEEESLRNAPKGIVQIAHGMAEYLDRYDDFACYLAEHGFAVCGADWLAHGKNVNDPSCVGLLPAGAQETFIRDFHSLRVLMQKRFSDDLPYFVLGHSMGSFVARVYLARHGKGLAGAILSGTAQQPAITSLAGHALARLLGIVRGDSYRSAFIDSMGAGSYGKKIPHARTPLDWLNTDAEAVDAYINDPLCGAMFSVGGYASITALTKEMSSASCVRAVPRDLPILFIAGEQDPVGDFGKGPRAAVEQLRAAGMTAVEVKMYNEMRHEVLNHPDKQAVYADVLSWLEQQTGSKSMAQES